MTVLLLVRHGENDWVKKHRLAGWTPGVHLNENGHAQAAQLAEHLAPLPIKAVYSSPLVRCWETATHVAAPHELDLIEFSEMGEVRYGDWEGEKIEVLSKKKEWHTIQHAPSRFEFPAGESMRNVQTRAVNALEQLCLAHPDDMIVVCSHADVIKLVLAHYLGTHMDLFQRIMVSPASVSAINLTKTGGIRVLRINDNGPMRPPPEPEKKKEDATEATAADADANAVAEVVNDKEES